MFVNGLRLLTKIVVFARFVNLKLDASFICESRKDFRFLRVEGRTPNDDPATFRITREVFRLGENGEPDAPDELKVASAATLTYASIQSAQLFR